MAGKRPRELHDKTLYRHRRQDYECTLYRNAAAGPRRPALLGRAGDVGIRRHSFRRECWDMTQRSVPALMNVLPAMDRTGNAPVVHVEKGNPAHCGRLNFVRRTPTNASSTASFSTEPGWR